MAAIGIIINPNSRVNKKTNCSSVNKFKKIAGELADVRATQSIDELNFAIKDFKKRKYPYIAISGGDGTIHHVVTSIINVYKKNIPPILLLRDGTMNNIASSIGMKYKSDEALKLFANHVNHGKSMRLVQRDTIRIGERCGFLFGFGLTTNILNEVYVYEKKGFRQNVRMLGKTFAEAFMTLTNIDESDLSLLKTMNAKIETDAGDVNFSKVLCVIGGTVENIGMGFSSIYRANDIPGKFHVLISGMRPLQIVRELQKLMVGQRIENSNHFDEVCSYLRVKAKESFDYTIDGDIYTAGKELVVKAGVPLKFIIF
ncbi:MAG: hypothetical protein KBH06_01980 [Spirochaetes bacterium]|nr:hypothetical protein [Spirochaetota bacterium]